MKLPTIAFDKGAFLGIDRLLEKEWLITNGSGSYASSTVPGINTRKYHGLLVAALDPPGNRTICLSKLDEDVLAGGVIYRLGSNEFHEVIYPEGFKLISYFSIDPFPTYNYDLGDIQVSKTIFMPRHKNVVVIKYKVVNKTDSHVAIKLYPLLTCRYYHTVVRQSIAPLSFTLKNTRSQLNATFQCPQKATIICSSTEGEFEEEVNWIKSLYYRDEAARGETYVDDCFQPGCFEVQVLANAEKEFAVTCAVNHESQMVETLLKTVGGNIWNINQIFEQELNRKSELLSIFHRNHSDVPISDWLKWILIAADSFLVEGKSSRNSIIAGYHWFEQWGRDAFISLPGLMLVTGKYNSAKEILNKFSGYVKDGLIPNFISDKSGVPVYHTVDGTLWYVNAVLKYIKYTGDFGFVKDMLWEKLKVIVEAHQKGTLFDIHMDDDGLLMHGPRLTWMDACVGNDPITPRFGKAVEIQALWYNTLQIMELFAKKFEGNNSAKKYASIADLTRQSFNEKFWNPDKECLFDVINEEMPDVSLRPNQIFAVSLDYTMLDKEKSQKVVDIVNRELVTPYGLRTLALTEPSFVGKCSGDSRNRDVAYHNGTIWPWLLGPYVSAFIKINDYTVEAREQMLKKLILPLFTFGINQGGLGTINEIYDCDAPNEPRGCISQAWSIAEPLRAYIEDILQVKPNKMREI